ncbi:hypothetical protein EZV73_23300 [Acidaminobacter sp. JC074]|uniref:NAD(P)/FAD-dependent oxidoreductase n=1 Tax=Acidaminobacter sp. JC074 TaxID=2530199 RepID=UPI001F0E5F1F|nr:hypothetical protein [Acidaminobacter sp. JC074]MCH4890527.1 hypothetical protein [Acidaminobacter sp. JC074]
MIRLDQLRLNIDYNDETLKKEICKKIRIHENDLLGYKMVKRSLDARKRPNVFYNCSVEIDVRNEKQVLKKNKKLSLVKSMAYVYPAVKDKPSPIVVGMGPAGLFSAYILSELGLKPIVLERGEAVDERTLTVQNFWREGILNPNSNVQFGEGGAGTFSDGKLTTRSKDPRSKKVMEVLVKHGAPEEILYMNKPHVGTDILKDVVKSMREYILEKGGQVYFNAKVEDFMIEDDKIKGVVLDDGRKFNCQHVILAVGHSARDTYEKLYEMGLDIEQKPFAMGVRIEHHQTTIDENQYGDLKHRRFLGASDYKLTYQASNGRSVYSFCVCPGGMVVASSSEEGGLVVNGMSEHARDQKNINGALLVQVKPEDFGSDHPLAGVEFQRKYERLAFDLGGKDYTAPSETVGSFLSQGQNAITSIQPSYRPKVLMTSIDKCLPTFVTEALREGIKDFGKKIKGFDDGQAVLTAIESRSSAPIRMIRNRESMESNFKGLYPVGEGAGYAGGIVSSAIDGIRIAEIVANV